MKHITLIIIAVLFSVTAFAQQTFDNDFTQTKVMKVSGKTINKAGHIVFDGKDQLKMTYTEPSGDSFIIDGRFLHYRRQQGENQHGRQESRHRCR